jgi:hypothetical protein
MFKHQKQAKNNYGSGKAYNLLSPPNNPKQKNKQFLNSNMPKFKPINLYSTYLSPSQNDKNFSVKNITSPDDKLNQDLLNKFSNYQKTLSGKMLQSPNTTNSDLLTVASLTSQQSNESLISNNTNTSTYIPTTFHPMINNYTVCQFPAHRYNYSMSNYPQMNYFYPNNNPFLNGNYSNMTMKFNNRQQGLTSLKSKKSNQNFASNNLNNKYKKNSNTNNYIKSQNDNNANNGNNDKIEISNFNSNNSIKSGSGSGSDKSNTDSSKNSSNNNTNSELKNDKKANNGANGGAGRKKYFNKFNSPKENNTTNENTVILTLKIKVAPNDFRTFNLKKYDDLFISLEKFFDLNKIKQDLVKPIVTKIFAALNKIFWLLNNKIGIYDQEYLNSLHKLWIKNNEQIPKRSNSKEEDSKSSNSNNDGRNKKNKENSDKSTISSSDSSDGLKKHKKIMSNSFQNMDNTSESGKDEESVKSI